MVEGLSRRAAIGVAGYVGGRAVERPYLEEIRSWAVGARVDVGDIAVIQDAGSSLTVISGHHAPDRCVFSNHGFQSTCVDRNLPTYPSKVAS